MGFPGRWSLTSSNKGDEEALNAVCVTVCGIFLHWSANAPDLNPNEQIWRMAKGSINRKQCNSPKELSVQAQAILAAISIESTNEMVWSYSTRMCTFLAQRGQWLDVDRSVVRDWGRVKSDLRVVYGLQKRLHMHEKPRQNLSRES
jgi:hypothetical protein